MFKPPTSAQEARISAQSIGWTTCIFFFQSFPKPDASPTPCADGGHFPRTLQAAEGKQSTANPLLIEWVLTVCLGTQGGGVYGIGLSL